MSTTRLVLLALLVPGSLTAQKQYTLTGNETAIYNLAGQVQVVAGTGNAVIVTATTGGEDAARLGFEQGEIRGRSALVIRYPGDRVIYSVDGENSSSEIQVRSDGTFGDNDGKGMRSGRERVRVTHSGSGLEAHADLRVSVPAGKSVAVYIGVGRITASNVNGSLHLDTQSGDIEATAIRGDLNIDTGSGSVKVTNVSGTLLSIDTGSGGVDGTGLTASDLSVDTGSGSVTLGQVTAKKVHVDTGSGDVDVDLLGSIDDLNIDTGSGSVTVRMPATVNAQLAIETGSGDITTDFPVTVRRTGDDELVGTIGTGAGTIQVDTGSGDVRLLKR